LTSVSSFRLRRAADLLRRGGLLAYATEGVFGIGCDPGNHEALCRLIAAKGRSKSKGLILIAASLEQALQHAEVPDEAMLAQVRASWPGPVTWVLPARPDVSPLVTGGRDSVAVRVTAHCGAAALCEAFGGALVSSSANLSGRPAAKSLLSARRALGGRVDAILPGQTGGLGRPSTIRDGRDGKVLRGGD
jgi:L-threonylcarbamoyladenylate synthase